MMRELKDGNVVEVYEQRFDGWAIKEYWHTAIVQVPRADGHPTMFLAQRLHGEFPGGYRFKFLPFAEYGRMWR
jgi:hypothetical protein